MGASQSYQKAIGQQNIDFQYDIDDLNSFLYLPTKSAGSTTLDDTSDFDRIKNSIMENMAECESGENCSKEQAEKLFNNLEKIKRSIDLIMLYDNYNLKNSVIIKDLSKKSNNQLAEIKKRTEYTDLINHELNVIKHKINKNNKIDKTLLIFIIIFVLLIIIVGFITALKFVKL
jgi:hypothetical protein